MGEFSADDVRGRLGLASIDVDAERAQVIAETANSFSPLLDQVWSVPEPRLAKVVLPTPAPWSRLVP